MTRVVIAGAAGRMGHALLRCADAVEGIVVTGAIERPDHPAIGSDAGIVAGRGELGVRVTAELGPALDNADVLIDFTFHSAVPVNVAAAAERGKGAVVGTTALEPAERAVLDRAATKIPILFAPNMSLGVNLLFALVKEASRALGLDYDVEIVETHHRHKQDAPSGTALRLAEKAAEGRNQDLKSVLNGGRQGVVGARPRGQIAIHAVRAGDIVGDHSVIFANDGERVEIAHRATSRDGFAMGALRAALWIHGREAGLYDMQNMLGL